MGNVRVDLYGKRFGEWTVGNYLGTGYWQCTCDCGVKKQVSGKTLRNGKSTSCGHNTSTLKDLTNKKFNEWTALRKLECGKWLCRCSCGVESKVSSYDLRYNKSKDCGHSRKDKLVQRNKEGRIKLEGTKQNEWEVLKYLGDKQYECKCSCGKVKSVSASDLVNGISKSCGHNNGRHRLKDLTGVKFGELTAVRYIGDKQWECLCSCGKKSIVLTGNLRNGSVRSCGCKQYNKIEKSTFIEVIDKYIKEHGEKPFVHDLSKILDRHEGNINRYINEYCLRKYINSDYGSKAERELLSLFSDGEMHNRQILNGQELDIYYPDKKLAIEFNGNYWHSDIYKDKYYHQNKTIECAKLGIQLIHIFEYEWNDDTKREKIIQLLSSKLVGNKTVIRGRNTTISLITNSMAKEFLDKYHIQNNTNASINIGSFYNNELIGVMTFGKPRFDNESQYELIRLAWKHGVSVTGGTDKLFKYFIKNYNPNSILTYCDISKFTGNVYTRLGFKPFGKVILEPNYVWVNTLDNIVLTRYNTMKHKLIEAGLGSKEQTEDEIMGQLGYLKIYDSGNIKLIWNKRLV